MKAIINYLREYFADIKLSEVTFKSLSQAAAKTTQNI